MKTDFIETENLFSYYRKISSFEFAQRYISELYERALMPGAHHSKSYIEKFESKNKAALSKWETENAAEIVNSSSSSLLRQEKYLLFLEQEVKNVATTKLSANKLKNHIAEHNKVERLSKKPLMDVIPDDEYSLNTYMEIVADFKVELIASINQAIGTLKNVIGKPDYKSIAAQIGTLCLTEDEIENDARIPVKKEDREKLITDFMKLMTCKILTKEDVVYWLRADFQGFKPISANRVLKPSTETGIIIRFIREIYVKYHSEEGKLIKEYRAMLKTRINLCSGLTDEYLKAHFSDRASKKYPAQLVVSNH